MNSPASSEGPHEQAEELCPTQQWQPLRSEIINQHQNSVPIPCHSHFMSLACRRNSLSVKRTPLDSNQQPSVP